MAMSVCVELISEVRIGLGVCWDDQHGCDDQFFSVRCYVHESTFSMNDLSFERMTTARIGYLVFGATPFEIGAVCSQGGHRDRSARLIADVYAQARRSGLPAN